MAKGLHVICNCDWGRFPCLAHWARVEPSQAHESLDQFVCWVFSDGGGTKKPNRPRPTLAAICKQATYSSSLITTRKQETYRWNPGFEVFLPMLTKRITISWGDCLICKMFIYQIFTEFFFFFHVMWAPWCRRAKVKTKKGAVEFFFFF